MIFQKYENTRHIIMCSLGGRVTREPDRKTSRFARRFEHPSLHPPDIISITRKKKHGENTSGMMQKNDTGKIGQSTLGKFVQATFAKTKKKLGHINLNSWHILMTNLMFDCDKSESEIMTNPNQRLELGEPGSVRLG